MLSEEDLGGTGVRFSAEALLQSLVAAAGAAGPPAVVDALQRRLAEASALQARFCSLLRAQKTTVLPPALVDALQRRLAEASALQRRAAIRKSKI